jgi:hypothetical protein
MQFTLLLLAAWAFNAAWANEFESDPKWSEYKKEHTKLYKTSDEELERFVFYFY